MDEVLPEPPPIFSTQSGSTLCSPPIAFEELKEAAQIAWVQQEFGEAFARGEKEASESLIREDWRYE